tara:strand:- start:65 stop:250 length:186 start_codon:yes stop_codon:yes gene_type:complete
MDVKKTAEKNAKPNTGPENQKKRVENVEQDNYLRNKNICLYKWLGEKKYMEWVVVILNIII